MGTNSAADRGERISLANKVDCLEVFLLLDELNVALDVDLGGALHLAGRVAALEDAEDVGRGLSVKLGDSLARAEATVELVRYIDGARLSAFAAAGASILINKSWKPSDSSFKMPRFTL
ncbi:MAG: hypothetical protein ABSD28_21570 [Tepidisphaeraceae bacterium]